MKEVEPKRPKVVFKTLGCRVNQYETQGMRELCGDPEREAPGCGTDGPVEVVVINTCTVTREADRESRYWIRRARREHPSAKIIVTGCGVEKDGALFSRMPGVHRVLSNDQKAGIATLLGGEDVSAARPESGVPRVYSPLSISRSQARTRAFVKIQDGCNHACSFCKVVLVRGRSRSRPLGEIVGEVVRLRDNGYREVVFAGIQLGAYGLDLTGSSKLPGVLEACAKIDGIERLRLSSIEPLDVSGELLSAMKGIGKVMPHLHLPLQSGDDSVLGSMNRRYRAAFYEGLTVRLREELPDFMFSLDVMPGFPGEGEEEFENTVKCLRRLRPLHCHVFPYSRREGTRAARMTGEVKPETIRRRVRSLTALSKALALEVMAPYEGRVIPVLVEEARGRAKAATSLSGHTPNFMKVVFEGSPESVGKILPVRLKSVREDAFEGERT
ncbi:MAG: tRNA (N(6)-L-threonylcarbamoyladenosine(37)-C(2))-methylthiotransferase MtaB [Candidatus Omnitrophota bacterium]|jgi:threonylcarbamoyladenosine tRNA methylthiotransferase MtaB